MQTLERNVETARLAFTVRTSPQRFDGRHHSHPGFGLGRDDGSFFVNDAGHAGLIVFIRGPGKQLQCGSCIFDRVMRNERIVGSQDTETYRSADERISTFFKTFGATHKS